MDSINDIEPIIENSFEYFFYALYAFIFLIVLVIAIFFIKKLKQKKQNPYEKLDFSNPNKELLYQFSIIAKKQGENSKLKELLKELEPYKYSKNAKEIDKEIIDKIKAYIKDSK